ncbi:MAG: helix-turn-helix transcriptional regulator [Ruminococcus sp.]|nr:helix-turn-helix transcriptional regulator [Ruminococcus sp.]
MGIERINEFKRQKGFSNAKLAEISGVNISTVEKIMSGRIQNPQILTVVALCRAVGCSLDDIMDITQGTDFSVEEMLYIEKIRSLDDYGKKAVESVLDVEYERCSQQDEDNFYTASFETVGKAVARSDGGGQKTKYIPEDDENIVEIDDL